jgi:hypothetical protein
MLKEVRLVISCVLGVLKRLMGSVRKLRELNSSQSCASSRELWNEIMLAVNAVHFPFSSFTQLRETSFPIVPA